MKAIDTFNQALKNNNYNFCFYGEDIFYLDLVFENFKHQLSDIIDETEVIRLNAEKVSFQLIYDELNTLPFFGDKKLVIVENLLDLTAKNKSFFTEQEKKAFINYLMNPNQTTILALLINGNIDKRKKFTKELLKNVNEIKAEILDAKEINDYLQELNQPSQILTAKQIELIVALSNEQLELAVNHFKKIRALSETESITDDLIYKTQIKDLAQNLFDLSKYLIAEQTESAFSLFYDLMKVAKPGELIKINGILISQFRFFLSLKILIGQGKSNEQIANELKGNNSKPINPNRIRFASREIKRVSELFLVNVQRLLVEADFQMKSGSQDNQLLFETLLLKIINLEK
ncbi:MULTISPECIES: DNA polymerase III subunit delta [unclassified Enterococcus]|uniref:DNA polymerase III subunit delta n=1 Tax=unclassified Enterococcus TaxID=2608891 RepID=UPI0015574948|nr:MULTISPECIES: DNA polymerase III subunit delta [unclassified Enterococcus]MBS7576473.1 DNA polymerase III subunit delta [Enterococcus sp. MMGLQ5-2]MBS7583705.1 DNA polymerase III subunit delta [Enterococcus sp. MMGLQ5-1]NPD11566.1 DNA polymerase III subunit delta [Enterococcus sp. MMGLQ5-1]NPD36310.1 DNA polymerase III subunit delta [Enterococcus sp. MMGLQ5-2]